MFMNMVPKGAIAITKSDTTSLNLVGLYVGTAGDVAVVDQYNVSTTLPSVPAGSVLWLAIKKVLSTGTSASNMVGFIP